MRDYVISGLLTNEKDKEKTIWIDFPLSDDDLMKNLKEIGLDEPIGYRFTDWEFENIPDLELDSYSVDDINDLMNDIDYFEDEEINHIMAICENEVYKFIDFITRKHNLCDFSFFDNVFDYENLGIVMTDKFFDIPDELTWYIDYKGWAEEKIDGFFTSLGFVEVL